MIDELIANDRPFEKLARTFRVIWAYSSIAMFQLGNRGVSLYDQLRHGGKHTRIQAILLGLGVLIFGIYGFPNPYPNWHLFLLVQLGSFIFTGVLL